LIKARELPCHFVWFVERRVDRAGKAEAVGDRRKRGQHGERVGAPHDVEVVDPAPVLPQPQALGEEKEVEQPPLGGPRQMDERLELDLAA